MENTSNWLSVRNGARQGSIVGPFLFGIFQNDLHASLCDIYNYADDNTVGASGETTESVQEKLKEATDVMLSWYDIIIKQANPKNFKYIMFTRSNNLDVRSISIPNIITLYVQPCVNSRVL